MKYERFEDTPLWQAAADLAAAMFSWTNQSCFRGKGDLANQIQRATLSISNNIAEGFERGTTNELVNFLYYSRGSAGEVRSMLNVMTRMPDFSHLEEDISRFRSVCESISRQIRGWTAQLQESDIKGQRHLNRSSRQKYERKQSQAEFMKQMEDFRADLKKRVEANVQRQQERRDAQSNGGE